MGIKKVKIAHLYPNELNLYGDIGNIICLKKRLEDRGFKTEIISIGVNETIGEFDIMFIGGGQDREMKLISHDLIKKSKMLTYCVHSGKVILAICGGYQLLGEYYKSQNGDIMKFSGALPFHTIGNTKRMIGNLVFETPFGKAVGFENHSGQTFLPSILKPLGKVIAGSGNNGIDKNEGLLFNNTFATYAHGPFLPKNPNIADEIIKRAVKCELAPLGDETENLCHSKLIERFSK